MRLPESDGPGVAATRNPATILAQRDAHDTTSMPRERCPRSSATGVPEPHGSFVAGAGEQTSVRTERHTKDHAGVTPQGPCQGPVSHPPYAHLTRSCSRCQVRAVFAERDARRVVERFAKYCSREVGFFEASVLRLDFLEVCLTYLQAGQVYAAQITAHEPQQVYEIPRRSTVLLNRGPADLVQYGGQPLLDRLPSVISRKQPRNYRLGNEALLTPPHVVFGLRFDH